LRAASVPEFGAESKNHFRPLKIVGSIARILLLDSKDLFMSLKGEEVKAKGLREKSGGKYR
jgi:hypothetical protein